MAKISHFPRYSQKENIVTNNTMLLMSRVYDYNRLKFGRLLRELDERMIDIADRLHLQFIQQKGTGASVVDGLIVQEGVTIIIETKLEDRGFSRDQLERHLSLCGEKTHRILILLSPGPEGPLGLVDHFNSKKIPTIHTTFQQLINAATECLSAHDEDMRAVLEDFTAFCSTEKLLPRDKFTMFTPPCGQSFDENIEYMLYYCPRSWNRRASKYLGIYSKKSIRSIGRISKIVDCKIDTEKEKVVACEPDISELERERIVGATKAAFEMRGWNISDQHKFYLCDKMVETNFEKTSPGGIQGHRYFDLGEVLHKEQLPSIETIGELLKGQTWE